MNKPLVSVIMTAYNREKFIGESIESILWQTYDNWELIIVDDGSTDRSDEIVRSYINDPRVRYVKNNRNLGRANSLNISISLCRGKYICIQDSDDISFNNRLEKQVEILEKNQECGLVFTPADFIDIHGSTFNRWGGNGFSEGVLPPKIVFYKLYFEDNFIPYPSVMMRVFMDGNLYYNTQFPHCIDFEYLLRIARMHKFYYLPQPLVKMRRGIGHISMIAMKEERFGITKKILKHVYNLYYKDNFSPITFFNYYQAMSYQLIRESSYYLNNSSKLKGKLIALQAMFYNPIDKRVLIFVMEHIFSKKILKLLAKIKHLLL